MRISLIIGIGYGLFHFYEVYFVQAMNQALTPEKDEEKPMVRVSRVRLISYTDEGDKEAEIFGREADVDPKTQEVSIRPVTLVIYEKGERKATILAQEGRRLQDRRQEFFELEGKVEGTASDGRKLFTTRLLYYPRQGLLKSPVRFKTISDPHILEGDELDYYIKEERAEMRGDVIMRFHETKEALEAERAMGQEAWR